MRCRDAGLDYKWPHVLRLLLVDEARRLASMGARDFQAALDDAFRNPSGAAR
jgi:hypothetical protein